MTILSSIKKEWPALLLSSTFFITFVSSGTFAMVGFFEAASSAGKASGELKAASRGRTIPQQPRSWPNDLSFVPSRKDIGIVQDAFQQSSPDIRLEMVKKGLVEIFCAEQDASKEKRVSPTTMNEYLSMDQQNCRLYHRGGFVPFAVQWPVKAL